MNERNMKQKGPLTGTIVLMLGIFKNSVQRLTTQESESTRRSTCATHYDRRSIEDAWLKAQRLKDEAFIELQRRHFAMV